MKENLIKTLIDARVIEAMKKKISLKLITIARYMGHPIIEECGRSALLPDFWDQEYNPEQILLAEEDNPLIHVGYVYDSLKYGVNLEIITNNYLDKTTLISANMDGQIVYLEEEGTLKGYAPDIAWEKHVDDLYENAKNLEQKFNKNQKEENLQNSKPLKAMFLEKLKSIWGYK